MIALLLGDRTTTIKERIVKILNKILAGYPQSEYQFTGEFERMEQGSPSRKKVFYCPIYRNQSGESFVSMVYKCKKPSAEILNN